MILRYQVDRAVSLDASINSSNTHRNELAGTYNLATYNAGNVELRYEFDYIVHGYIQDDDSNGVFVRGSDNSPWVRLMMFDQYLAASGKTGKSGSLSVTDALLGASQNFSSSCQVMFMQNDRSLISMRNFGRGITIDNLKMYTVQNDIQLLDVVSPIVSECGLTGMQSLTVRIRNGVNQQLNNVQLFYKLDNGAVVSETLASIAGKQTVNFTFSNKLDLTVTGKHTLSVWLAATGDTYLLNDSLLNYEFYNQPLIKTYPYLDDFEAGNGDWYANGINSTWAYGDIAAPNINKAASGVKGWKTNLTGIYSDDEQSYLYSSMFRFVRITKSYFQVQKSN